MPDPRALSEADLVIAAQLMAGAYPHRAHEPRSWLMGLEPSATKHWVVDNVQGGQRAAYLALWAVHGTKFRFDLIVDPAHRNRGLGTRLLDWLVEHARALGATSLQARTYSTERVAMRVLDRRGFRETMRMTGLVLDDVARVQLHPLAVLQRKLEGRGIRITTLARELATDRSAWAKLRDTNQAAYVGWPDPDPSPNNEPPKPESPEEFRRRAAKFGMMRWRNTGNETVATSSQLT